MNSETRLKLAIGVALIFMLVEIVGGHIAHSLAIFADAAHLFSDIAGFILALFALIVSRKPKSLVYTFGYGRAEILGALFSIGLLWMVTIYLVFEAFFRAVDWFEGNSQKINGKIMFGTAVFGIFVNLVLIVVFHEEHEQNVLHGHNCGGDDDLHDEGPVDNGTSHHSEHNHDHHNHEHNHSNHIELSPIHSSTTVSTMNGSGHHPSTIAAIANISSSAAVFTPMRTMTSSTLQPITSAIGKATPAGGTISQQQQRYTKMDDFDEEISPLPLLVSNNINITTPVSQSNSNAHDHHQHHHDGDNCCYGDHYQPHGNHNNNNNNSDDSHSMADHHSHSSSSHHDHSSQSHDMSVKGRTAPRSHNHDHSHSHSHGHGHDSNMKAAALHVMTDMIQSIGVALAGAVVWFKPDWQIVDPICTLLFSILVLHSTLPLAGTLVVTLMEGVPCHIDCARVESSLRQVKGVTEVGSLRIWSVSTHRSAATAHIQVTSEAECARVLQEAHRVCHDDFSISFVTLQVQALPLTVAADGVVVNGSSNGGSHGVRGSGSSQKPGCPWVCDHV